MKIKYPYTKPQSPTPFNSNSHPSHFCTKLVSKTTGTICRVHPGSCWPRDVTPTLANTNRTTIYQYRVNVSMLSGKRIQTDYDSADIKHCPNIGETNDSQL